jgi:hypothetical protein
MHGEARGEGCVMLNILDLPDGMHEGVPESVYHAKVPGVVSTGALKILAQTPSKYRYWLTHEDKPATKPLSFGRACHMAILEPDVFDRTYLIEPDFGACRKDDRTGTSSEQAKENKKRRDGWREAHTGATLLESKDGQRTLAMIHAIAAHPVARGVLIGGVPEITGVWTCPETGLRCKLRGDYWVADDEMCADIKSSADASPGAWARSCATYRYNWQEAHYRRGFAARACPIRLFVFLVVESDPPHDIALYELDADDVRRGEESVRRHTNVMAECIRTGIYPGFPEDISTLKLPAWAKD